MGREAGPLTPGQHVRVHTIWRPRQDSQGDEELEGTPVRRKTHREQITETTSSELKALSEETSARSGWLVGAECAEGR